MEVEKRVPLRFFCNPNVRGEADQNLTGRCAMPKQTNH